MPNAKKAAKTGDLSKPYSPQIGGKVAPLLPEEYAFNFVQHKWNENGFGVNHVGMGSWLSSSKHRMVRVDNSDYDWVSNNATVKGPITAGLITSLFDFSHVEKSGNITNHYIEYKGRNNKCTSSELPMAASQGQLFPPKYIQENGQYSGQETFAGIGITYTADKWVTFIGTTVVSFYFDGQGNWVRYDQSSPGLKTTVITLLYNLNKNA
ncbi:hypothetical protein DFQ29_009536, partial [Apophysomyces sp. BC1021]